ncbi:Glucose-1-phosphate adenylyltransferase [Slackia heliotrinireducens]|uniref:Glucose-1-phosphate adenylyltransferase n=1 Tax=Slackia heliotrinireducens (strain ATCC 29202 / DSM 20476 / NCTC 11029 / RHS 1) TaxID=471855 RepID=C7N740_SLAHD|nr:glucose-1-phosphate adenylyltransferase [Slackia heliotrinireducens]ACV22725.1 glucose-1-phosphate adenylyltransferase [Slackia heliotrinireducens DSM 20476]VEH01356.1 Glucose-1-phosphate adenylyltransferase [Slackia heliotrinireducens]
MSNRKRSVAMILAGGQGSRLGVLTRLRAKPAVPYGGKYRIIDFPLSNCANSGIDVVGVLTQYEPFVLNSYIGNGAPWDLNTSTGGAYLLSPHTRVGDVGSWYAGTADAIYQNIQFIDRFDPQYVVVLSGDHIYKMDYSQMIAFHEENGADATIAVMPVPIEEASRFGILATDEAGRVTDFVEKPADPPSNLASMGIYVFDWAKVRRYLEDDAADAFSSHDFGKNVIPAMLGGGERLFAFRFEGYWRDVGTIDSLWEANMDLLEEGGDLDLSDNRWTIYSRNPDLPAARIGTGAILGGSMIAEGCDVEGSVLHSMLFQGVSVGSRAQIVDSLVMAGAKVGAGTDIQRAVIAEDVIIGEDCIIGRAGADLAVIGPGAVIESGVVIAPGESVEPNAVVSVEA